MTTEAAGAEGHPDLIVLTLQWREPATGLASQETFGPWTASEDLSHMIAASDFIAGWHRLTGLKADVATVAIVADPAERLRELEAKAECDRLLIAKGVVSAAGLREGGNAG
jgi:hypothetical protein